MKAILGLMVLLAVANPGRYVTEDTGNIQESVHNAGALDDAMPSPPSEQALQAAESYNYAKGGQTLVVMYDGRVLRESYANGGSEDRVQLLASGTKGFTGMIGAIAAHDGIIVLDTPVSEVLHEWRDDPLRSQITYRHLLNMSSGLEELHDQRTWEDFLLARAIYPPGSTFIYGPDPNIFGLALQRKLGGEKVEEYMNRRLFQPLGIRVEWRGSFEDGNPQLSGGAYVRANEWIKFGEFARLMFAGAWKGPDLLSEQYFAEVFKSSKAHPAYGFYWWMKEPVPESLAVIIDRENKDQFTRQIKPIIEDPLIPDDFVMAKGAYEQQLYVIPSLKLTVVRNGPRSAAGSFRDTEFLDLLLSATATPGTADPTRTTPAAATTAPPSGTRSAATPTSVPSATDVAVPGDSSGRPLILPALFRNAEILDAAATGAPPGMATSVAPTATAGPTRPVVTPTPIPSRVVRDLRYAETAGVDPNLQSLDLYLPAVPDGPRPVLAFVHGGGWQNGDKDSVLYSNLVQAALARGYVAASINYRLAPEHAFPAHAEDVGAAVGWLHAHAAEHGADPAGMVLVGHSAGAHLVALVGADERYLAPAGLGVRSIAAVVPLDTEAYDLARLAARFGGQLPSLWGDVFGQDPASWAFASPVTYLAPGRSIPPMAVAYSGGGAPFQNPDRAADAEDFAARLRAAGVTAEVIAAPQKTHQQIAIEFGQPGDPVTEAVFGFLERETGRRAP